MLFNKTNSFRNLQPIVLFDRFNVKSFERSLSTLNRSFRPLGLLLQTSAVCLLSIEKCCFRKFRNDLSQINLNFFNEVSLI
ncbi:MAG: hypothetical protein ACTS6G_00275 [Candidatus Hodgkinia cicadicola]